MAIRYPTYWQLVFRVPDRQEIIRQEGRAGLSRTAPTSRKKRFGSVCCIPSPRDPVGRYADPFAPYARTTGPPDHRTTGLGETKSFSGSACWSATNAAAVPQACRPLPPAASRVLSGGSVDRGARVARPGSPWRRHPPSRTDCAVFHQPVRLPVRVRGAGDRSRPFLTDLLKKLAPFFGAGGRIPLSEGFLVDELVQLCVPA